MDSSGIIDQRYHTPEDIRVEQLREIEADPLRHIIKNQEVILKMLEDVLELLKDIKYPQWQDNVVKISSGGNSAWYGTITRNE